MFLILTIIAILILLVSNYFYNKSDYHHCDFYESWGILGGIASGIFGVVLIVLICVYIFNKPTISNKIEMYEEENKKVETQLVESVNIWLTRQETTFESISSIDGVTTYLVKYPELKGDSLVDELMETYKNNSKEIKQLKSRKINLEGIAKIGWFGK